MPIGTRGAMRYGAGAMSNDNDHRRSIRLPAYDYREAGAYFVTICTFERSCLLSETPLETIVRQVWRHLSRRGHVDTDEFVVMPNHIHGIIWIAPANPVGAQHTGSPVLDCGLVSHRLSNRARDSWRAAPLRRHDDERLRVHAHSLGAVVRAFKSASARRINELKGTPGAPVWQRNYYERVIRDQRELNAAREYIRDNPRKWAEDPNNPAICSRAP